MTTSIATFTFSLGNMNPERVRAVLRSLDNMLLNEHQTVLVPIFVTPGTFPDDAVDDLQLSTNYMTRG